jgi:magnesium transporter
MSLKEIRTRDAVRVAARELLSGVLLGLSLGVIAFVFAYLFKHRVDVAMVVALTVVVICIWSNLIGCLIPLAAQKLKLDPALVSSPFITTLVDATGLAIYIAFAHLLIAQL